MLQAKDEIIIRLNDGYVLDLHNCSLIDTTVTSEIVDEQCSAEVVRYSLEAIVSFDESEMMACAMLGIRNMYEQRHLTAAAQNMKRIAKAFWLIYLLLLYLHYQRKGHVFG